MTGSADRVVLDDYLLAIDHLEARLMKLDAQLATVATTDPYREPVGTRKPDQERRSAGWCGAARRIPGWPGCWPASRACWSRSTVIGDYAAPPGGEVAQPTEPFRSGGVLLVRGRNIGTLIGRG